MRFHVGTFLIFLALLIAGCTDTPVSYDSQSDLSSGGQVLNFVAPLNSEAAGVESNATGLAKFKVNKEGTEISYKLIVANIENVFQAHIHLAATGQVIVWLYPEAPPAVLIPGRSDGVLIEGTFSAANFVGPLAGEPLSTLIELMSEGNTYVNVHTNDFIPPTNTGPGDFPGGEISGFITHGNGIVHGSW